MADQQGIDPQDLERLLDEESDEEFGLPEFKEHLADTLTPAVLKDWTAQDFASIYVRFRPHLDRHARRFLQNPSQVEEVVQDAFLYLMTTLPELDSELGVLRFLKWKTRLLALDVIRANSKAQVSSLEFAPDLPGEGPELSSGLERADDAAIVSLALAKLQPRHREALIATLYEEKSNEVVAAQMGLSNNAFRQLLFRARSAFRQALVGEAETAGKSISEILSIAARKAAQDSGKIIASAGAFLLVLALSLSFAPSFLETPSAPLAEPAPVVEAEAEPEVVVPSEEPVVETETEVAPEEPVVAEVALVETPVNVSQPVAVEPAKPAEPTEDDLRRVQLMSVLDASLATRLASDLDTVDMKAGSGTVVISAKNGLTAHIAFDIASETVVQHAYFVLKVDGYELTAVPKVSLSLVERGSQTTVSYASTDLMVGDFGGSFGFVSVNDTLFSRSGLMVDLVLDNQGSVISAKLRVIPRV
jgi:RNA polymerase sigma-70 factor (ECF subfamily)